MRWISTAGLVLLTVLVSCKIQRNEFTRQNGEQIREKEVYLPILKRSFVKARYINGRKAYKGRRIISSWQGYPGMCGYGMKEPVGTWKYWNSNGNRTKKEKRKTRVNFNYST